MIDLFTRSLASAVAHRPVIVAGSTGTRPSTARLIASVASLDQGAVILPGARPRDAAVPLAGPVEGRNAAHLRRWPAAWWMWPSAATRNMAFSGCLRLQDSASGRSTRSRRSAISRPDLEARRAIISAALLPALTTEAWGEPGFPARCLGDQPGTGACQPDRGRQRARGSLRSGCRHAPRAGAAPPMCRSRRRRW